MNKFPDISVILPVYNGERYLRAAIESMVNQTYGDFELICVNDGSSDRSIDILRELAAKDARIRVISRPNTGIVGALNHGIAAASGRLLARMDSDDVATPQRFERQVAFLDEHAECVAVGSSVMIMDEQGNDICIDDALLDHRSIEERLLSGHGAICHPTVIMRADAVRCVGGYREEYRLATEDMDLFLRLGETGQLANIREPLLRYRWHLKSISHQRKNAAEAAKARRLMLQEAYLRRGIADSRLPMDEVPIEEMSEVEWLIEQFHRWSVEAGKAGRFLIAQKYAMRALQLEMTRKKSWWVLCHSIVGPGITAQITRMAWIARKVRTKSS